MHIIALIIFVGLAAIIIWIADFTSVGGRRATAIDVLNRRLARGEIDRAEYEKKRKLIGRGGATVMPKHRPPPPGSVDHSPSTRRRCSIRISSTMLVRDSRTQSGHSTTEFQCPLLGEADIDRPLLIDLAEIGQKRTSLHSINSSARRRAEAIDADCKVMCWRGATNLSPLLSEFSSIFAGNRVQLFLCSRLFWCARRSSYFTKKRRRHNPEQEQFAIGILKSVPGVLGNKD